MSKHWRQRTRLHRAQQSRIGGARLAFLGGVAAALVYTGTLAGGESRAGAMAAGASLIADPWAVVITDGDTFRYHGTKIRVADIDAPEVRGRCPEESRLAARATDRLEALLHAGPFELRTLGRDEDRYGRKLRVVTRNGRSLGDQLVAEGLARTWTGRREPWC